MTTHENTYEATVEVVVEVAEGVDLAYWIDPTTGERRHRMEGIYPSIQSEADLLAHLAYNATFNGVTDASRLDGWADLERGQITMRVTGRLEVD